MRRSPLGWMTLALGLGMVLGAGCALRVPESETEPAAIYMGQEAADVARARARVYEEEIATLEKEREALAPRHRQLLKEASAYRNRAGRAWSDPALRDAERGPYALQYLTLTQERESQAERCAQMMRVYEAWISILKGKTQDQLTAAERFDAMRVPVPR